MDGEDEYGDAVADDEDSLLVKKEAKLLASEVAELKEGRGDEDLRCSS